MSDEAEIKKVMSILGKLSHKKNPRTKEYYSRIAKKRWKKQKQHENTNIHKK